MGTAKLYLIQSKIDALPKGMMFDVKTLMGEKWASISNNSGAVRNAGVKGEPVEVVIRAGENLFSLFQITPLLEGSQIKAFSRSWVAPLIKRDGLTVDEQLTKGCL